MRNETLAELNRVAGGQMGPFGTIETRELRMIGIVNPRRVRHLQQWIPVLLARREFIFEFLQSSTVWETDKNNFAAASPDFFDGSGHVGKSLLDSLNLPQVHAGVLPALEGLAQGPEGEALGVVETDSVPSTLLAADRAAKAARITLRRLRLAMGLGGKGFLYLDGSVHDVTAAVSAARAAVGTHLADTVVIPRLDAAVRDRLY